MTKRKPHSVRLPEDVDRDLRAFRKAHHNASFNKLFVDAIQLLIKTELAEDPGLRQRFEGALAPAVDTEGRPLKVVRGESDTA